jgi:hypothetical protein
MTGKYALRVFCSELLLFLMEGQEVARKGLLLVWFSLTVVWTVERLLGRGCCLFGSALQLYAQWNLQMLIFAVQQKNLK